MKQLYIILVSLFCMCLGKAFAQNTLQLQATNGEIFKVDELLANNKAKVFVFWSNYCKLCKLEMKGMRNIGKEWFEDYEAEIYFVSLENYPSDTYNKQEFLAEFLTEKGVFALHDQQMKFFNSVSNGSIPTTVLYNSKGELVQQWSAYDDGLERSVGMYFKKLFEAKTNHTSVQK